mmetsp:Transcript_17076/g.36071  ORF Transcript_17076/g.36071 Transcript_17076/m.36071 type:complete len:633 (+) Transcript_17076:35-1933(+)
MRPDDLIITLAYFSIPVQILASLYKYPRLHDMPLRIQILVILFAFFILCCGAGHALRCSDRIHGLLYKFTNILTASVSLATCLYLIPLVPSLMSTLDESLHQLEYLNKELESSQRKLMTFMAFLCHEIRNPLFVITSNISFMEDNGCHAISSDAQTQSIQAISQAADIMMRLVNDVLDISKLEAGKLELQEHEFDLRETLHAVVSSNQRLIQQRHAGAVKFTPVIEGDTHLPARVYADSVRFLQIVYNLLSNANKFTEKGEIQFRVSVVDDVAQAAAKGWVTLPNTATTATASSNDVNGLMEGVDYGYSSSENSTNNAHQKEEGCRQDIVVIKIEVKDTGNGIPSEQIELLFQPYAQAKLENYRHQGGTGLGLTIVSKLVHAMGGQIFVQSELGKGSTFEVYLPLRKSSRHHADGCVGGINPPHISNGFSNFCELNSHGKVQAVDVEMGNTGSAPLIPQRSLGGTLSSPPSSTIKMNSKKQPLAPFDLPPDTVVLVVDDNAMNRSILKRMLTQFKLAHVEAANGQEAVDIMLSSRNYTSNAAAPEVALVLMDLSMPVMDGYQATSTIRRYPVFANLPIVALTAATIEEGKQHALEVGVTEYRTKPIKRDMLHSLCQQYLPNPSSGNDTREIV